VTVAGSTLVPTDRNGPQRTATDRNRNEPTLSRFVNFIGGYVRLRLIAKALRGTFIGNSISNGYSPHHGTEVGVDPRSTDLICSTGTLSGRGEQREPWSAGA
jgi:hypothetical protein